MWQHTDKPLVLIETYWNVNVAQPSRKKRDAAGINRNILECKYA